MSINLENMFPRMEILFTIPEICAHVVEKYKYIKHTRMNNVLKSG